MQETIFYGSNQYYDKKEFVENYAYFLKKFRPHHIRERKLFNFRYKKTPHYFDLKCRLDCNFNLLTKSIALDEIDIKPFNYYSKPDVFKQYSAYLYIISQRYVIFQTWFDYWKLGFLRKSNKQRSKYSIARTRQTLFDLCSCNFEKKHSLFLTLTYDINKKLPSTIYDVTGAFNYDKALIDIKRFVERFKRTFGETMKYVYFIETQNGKHNNYNFFTGAFHFHILIFNAMYFKMGFKYKDCKENAQKLWGHGIAFVEKVPRININNTCKYISKYISKDTLCVESGNHALHSSKGLKRPINRIYYDIPFCIDNCISLEFLHSLAMLPNGLRVEDLKPFYIDDNGKIYGDYLNTIKHNKLVIHSRYIDILIMRLPCFDDFGKPFINENCDFIIKIHCDLDYRKNLFRKRCL